MANSIERECITPAPRLASSSISSYEILRHRAGFGNDARVGGEDAVNIGVDLAFIRVQGGGEGGRGRVAPTSAERGDVSLFIDTLEPAGDDDRPFVEVSLETIGRDLANAGLGVGRIGQYADLAPRQADGLLSQGMDRHRDEGDRLLLTD